MNRQMRRAGQAIHKKNVKQAITAGDWQPFEDRTQEALPKFPSGKLKKFYANNIYSVQVFSVNDYLVAGIRRHDQSTSVSWDVKQRIKNEIFGTEASALEVFPRESDLVDQANMYWLWLYPCDDFNLKDLKI